MLSKIRADLKKINSSKLFSSANATKLLVEMVSIFLAVTLAFALNKWNENKNNTNLETKILKEIYRGLEADRKDMKANKKGHETGLSLLNEISPIITKDTTLDFSIYFEYNTIFRTFLSIQNNSGYESLKSVGLDKISNDTLLSQLVKLYEIDYQMIEKLEEQYKENQINELYFEDVNDALMPYAEIKEDRIIFRKVHTMPLEKKNKVRIYFYKIAIAREFSIMIYADVIKKVEETRLNVGKELLSRGVDLKSL